MKNNRPIFWQQGLFLQPQHFQLSDLYYQSLVAPLVRFSAPYLWGVSKLKIDQAALAENYVALEECDVLFPDGTLVECPGNAVIRSRTLESAFPEGKRRLKAYLGLRKWDELSENVTVVNNRDEVSEVTTRFMATVNPEEVRDLYENGPSGQVKRLSFVPRIFWETEKDQLANYHLIPIAEFISEEEGVSVNRDFIPPCLSLESSEGLMELVKEMRDKVAARCLRLEEYKSPRMMQTAEMEPGVFFLLMGLRTLARYAPWLAMMAETGKYHPLKIYEMMVQMAGELSLFSRELSATGQNRAGAQAIPSYDHQDPGKCFNALIGLIFRLLDEITFGPESVISLEFDGEYYTGETPSQVFSDRNVYYLSLRTGSDQEEVKKSIQSLAKLSARENMEILISRALPGMGLDFVPVPPPGLPQLSSTVYFKIDVASDQWEDVQRLGNVALYWDEAPEDLTAEIIVLRRS